MKTQNSRIINSLGEAREGIFTRLSSDLRSSAQKGSSVLCCQLQNWIVLDSAWPHLSHAYELDLPKRASESQEPARPPTPLPRERGISRPCWQQTCQAYRKVQLQQSLGWVLRMPQRRGCCLMCPLQGQGYSDQRWVWRCLEGRDSREL